MSDSDLAFDLDRIGGRKALVGLIDTVLASGEEAMKLYRAGVANRTKRKPDRSPVTEADEAVERRLSKHLRARYPEAGFLGEETGASGPENSGMRWVVDPIDGTRAFIRGIPTWSILVGLEAEGEPVVGIAYMPAADDLYVAVKGDGARGNGRPLAVSEIDTVAEATVTHGALSQFTDLQLGHLLPRLGQETYTQRGFADFAEAVKSDSAWGQTPIVAMSSRTSREDIERGHQVGFSDYVAKTDRDGLIDVLRETLEGKGAAA